MPLHGDAPMYGRADEDVVIPVHEQLAPNTVTGLVVGVIDARLPDGCRQHGDVVSLLSEAPQDVRAGQLVSTVGVRRVHVREGQHAHRPSLACP